MKTNVNLKCKEVEERMAMRRNLMAEATVAVVLICILVSATFTQSCQAAVPSVPRKPYFQRLAHLRANAETIDSEDVAELLEILRDSPEEAGLRPGQLHAFKNEIANILFAREPVPQGLPEQFIAMAEEKDQGPVWRDYCIQHLGSNLEKLPPATREECVKLFYRKTPLTESAIAGTALIALSNASDLPEIQSENVSRRAYKVAADEEMGPARITALQVCAENGYSKALPLARRLARSSSDINLRASALAAVGVLGGAEDIALLERSAKSGLYRVRTAARAALARLENAATAVTFSVRTQGMRT